MGAVIQLLASAMGGGGGLRSVLDGDDGPGDRPPRDPRGMRYEGPWLQQQLILSVTIGIAAFVAFSMLRRRSPALFAPRSKLKGYIPHVKGIDSGIFSWIMPTLKAEEIKILHVVGLDAAVLLSFFKMAFWVFLYLALWSCVILMPVNYADHGSIDGVAPNEEPKPDKPDQDIASGTEPGPGLPWAFRVSMPSTYHVTHLVSTYIFTLLILRALYKGLGKFVRSRQLYALDLLQSIPARTVEVRELPEHLKREKDLAEYFEGMGFAVESTVVVREVRGLKSMLAQRANALSALEQEWCSWLGNPTKAGNYDPDTVVRISEERSKILAQGGERLVLALKQGEQDIESARLIDRAGDLADPADGICAPNERERPTMRLNRWNPLSPRVDALTLLEARFRALDLTVQKMRSKDAPPSSVGFVTFVDGMSAQITSQAVHYPLPGACHTTLAPEPRDIIWSNIAIPLNERRVRQILVSTFSTALFLFYIPPLTFLASLLSPKVIQKYLPSLYDLLEKDERLKAFVATSLPSVAVISFNAILPLILEWTAYLQGLKARSLVEFSVLKRYYIFLLTSVIFIFLIATTALGVIADLAGNPMRIIDKLAQSLPRARQFSLSYVVFQALAVIPLQLLQLPIVFARFLGRIFARTPRDYAELNAPPQLYAGSVYPAALIVFTLCILYSIVMPLITVFGALYFALAYLVYKYKLLYVYYRSYESRGQAWPLCSARIMWALGLFQLFQLSLFSVRKQFLLSTLMLPLIILTVWFGVHLSRTFGCLSEFVSLSSIAEVNRPEINEDAANSSQLVQPMDTRLAPSPHIANTAASPRANRDAGKQSPHKTPNPIVAMRDAALDSLDPDETVLSRKRYAAKDETLFVAKHDRHTDYREPPAGGYYYGVLNTGRRRYGHPALTGTLPDFWPPVREEDGEKEGAGENATPGDSVEPINSSLIERTRKSSRPGQALVLSLRHRKPSLGTSSANKRATSKQSRSRSHSQLQEEETSNGRPALASNPKVGTLITTGDDDDCDLPDHQHETSASVWGSADRGEGPSSFVRPVQQNPARRLAANGDNISRDDGGDRGDRSSGAEEDDDNDEMHNERNEGDGDEDDFAGVYVHRTARSVQLPGSLSRSS